MTKFLIYEGYCNPNWLCKKVKKFLSGIKNVRRPIGQKQPGSIKLFLWIIGLIVLGSLTIREFYGLIQDYKYDNINTHVNTRSGTEEEPNANAPHIVLCIPRSFQLILTSLQQISLLSQMGLCKTCNVLEDHQWNVVKNVTIKNIMNMTKNEFLDYYRDAILEPMSKKLVYNESDEFDVLRLENFSWNQLISFVVWDIFDCMFAYDREHEVSADSFTAWCSDNEDLIDYLISNKTRVENLFRRFADILCSHLHFAELLTSSVHWPKEFCTNWLHSSPLAFFYNSFCFSLPLNDSGLTVVVDSTSDIGDWEVLNSKSVFPAEIHSYFGIITRTGEIFRPDYVRRFNSLYQSSDIAEAAYIQYSVPFTVMEDRNDISCYKRVTRAECKNYCMVNELVKLCKCVPFTLSSYVYGRQRSLPYCKANHTAKCRVNKQAQMNFCNDKCRVPCHFVSNSFVVNKSPYIISPQRRYFVLKIRNAVTVHVEFHTTFKTSREILFSQLGGIINLYLGFSGLTVIAGVLACVNLFKRFIRKRKKSVTINGTAQELGNVSQVVMSNNNSECVENGNGKHCDERKM